MNILKQAKTVGIIAILAVLAGCAGQVNESVQGPSKVESDAERAAREARQAEFLAKQEAAKADQQAANLAAKTAEQLRNNAMAADTLFFFGFDKSDLSQDALDDLDAVNLYPSAMKEAAEKYGGFPRGPPKIWCPPSDTPFVTSVPSFIARDAQFYFF